MSNMCKIMEELRDESYAEGIEKGIETGKAELAKDLAQKLFKKGSSVEEIAEFIGYSTETVEKWLTPKAG